MNNQNLINNIENLLIDISSNLELIKTEKDKSNILIDLTLNKTQNLYDLLLKIKTDLSVVNKEQYSEIIVNEVKEITKDEDIVNEEKFEEVISTLDEEIIQIEEIIEPKLKKEEILVEDKAEKPEMLKEETVEVVKNTSTKVNKVETSVEKEIIADRFKNKVSINETISVNKKDLASKLTDNPITNIKNAINISDRFIFIKELFNNDSDKYNSAIDKLNSFENLDNAMEYINNEFNWEPSNQSFKKLLDIVFRRYIVK